MKKPIYYLFILLLISNSGCFSNSMGESSQKGEIIPFAVVNEVLKLAKEKHADSVFIGLRSANNEYQLLRLTTGNTIDQSYVAPNGKSSRWDFYFAKDKDDFIKKDKFLARPETYEVKKDDHFGIRYSDGTFYYIDSNAFSIDSKLLGQNTHLSVTGILNPGQLLPKVKEELRRLHGNDDIKVIAYSLQSKAYAMPLNASWRNQTGKVGPVWEIAAMLTDDKRGAVVFIGADNGMIVQETQGIVMHK